ncbi:cytochrome P450 4V2-like [Bombyx mandarina]|uniref:Cytochrome P450 4V2-like n=1 Tax=Bombyx mandarina TaxID=7092 RepID=A0A6J2K368_BOMMA|nr:cytochrome P450 4V2-like [Bombyx mandarina]
MIVILLIVLVLGWISMFRYRRRNMYKLAAAIPDVDEHIPLLGIAHKFTGNTEEIMSMLQKYSYNSMKHNGLAKGWLGHVLYFALLNPVDLELVLKTCLEKDDLHRFMRVVIGYGGIFAPVSIWRRRRKIMVPAFSPKIVQSFVGITSEQSEKLASNLGKCVGKGKFSSWPFLSAYTLDSICEIILIKIKYKDSNFLISMNRILNIVCMRIFHLWLQPTWLFKLFPVFHEHQKCKKLLHDFVDEAIQKKREEIGTENNSAIEVDYKYDLGSYKSKTFLDLLITLSGAEKGYTNIELREEVLTLTVAGTDTSAVAIGFTLELLSKYPEIQEKVYKELCEVFGDSERPLVKEDLEKMKYLERVVKESLRLFPPVPFIIRKVLEDITLPSGNVLPAGSGVVVSIWGIHRDPKYWGPEAEHFDPDRFLPERFNVEHPCCYMPFSSGPRNCLGYQYAMISIKTSLSAILRRYKVVGEPEKGPVPQIRVKLDIMMKSVNGCQVTLERRPTK